EVDEPSVKIVSRKDFNRFFGSHAVADQSNVVSKCAQLDRPPRYSFDDAGNFLRPERDHVANLKRAIGMKRYSGKEIAERVLKRETDDHSEECRGGEERAEIYFLVDLVEDQDEENRKDDKREDVTDQSRSFITAANPENVIEEECVDD